MFLKETSWIPPEAACHLPLSLSTCTLGLFMLKATFQILRGAINCKNVFKNKVL